jgi:hypothetical protein
MALIDIINTWTNWQNNNLNGGGISFTETFDYSNQSALSQYTQYQMTQDSLGMTFDTAAYIPGSGTESSVTTNFSNDSAATDSQTYASSLTTTQSATYTVTTAINTGLSVTVTAGVPGVASGSVTGSVSVDLSSSSSQTNTETKAWNLSENINIPPYCQIAASIEVTTSLFNIPFTASYQLTGNVAVWFNNQVTLPGNSAVHWLWFPSIAEIISDCQNNNLIDTTGYTVNGAGVLATAAGTFAASPGISATVKVVQSPLANVNAATV